MKKIGTILILILFLSCSLTTHAKGICEESANNGVIGSFVSPRWVYQVKHTTYKNYAYNDTVEPSVHVSIFLGYDSANGNLIFASGDLNLKGVAYGFPTANEKQATYEGLLTAYINGNIE